VDERLHDSLRTIGRQNPFTRTIWYYNVLTTHLRTPDIPPPANIFGHWIMGRPCLFCASQREPVKIITHYGEINHRYTETVRTIISRSRYRFWNLFVSLFFTVEKHKVINIRFAPRYGSRYGGCIKINLFVKWRKTIRELSILLSTRIVYIYDV